MNEPAFTSRSVGRCTVSRGPENGTFSQGVKPNNRALVTRDGNVGDGQLQETWTLGVVSCKRYERWEWSVTRDWVLSVTRDVNVGVGPLQETVDCQLQETDDGPLQEMWTLGVVSYTRFELLWWSRCAIQQERNGCESVRHKPSPRADTMAALSHRPCDRRQFIS